MQLLTQQCSLPIGAWKKILEGGTLWRKYENELNEVVKENFIHETPLSTSSIQDDDSIADPSENDLVVNPHIDEPPIMAEQGQISPVTCCKKVCRILPTPVCRNNLLHMRHERTCLLRSYAREHSRCGCIAVRCLGIPSQ